MLPFPLPLAGEETVRARSESVFAFCKNKKLRTNAFASPFPFLLPLAREGMDGEEEDLPLKSLANFLQTTRLCPALLSQRERTFCGGARLVSLLGGRPPPMRRTACDKPTGAQQRRVSNDLLSKICAQILVQRGKGVHNSDFLI